MDALRQCISPETLRAALKSLPKTLEATYDRILSRIEPEHYCQVRQILQCLTFAQTPLTLEQVSDISIIDLDSDVVFDHDRRPADAKELHVISLGLACLRVVNVPNEKFVNGSNIQGLVSKTEVRLAHDSVKEYLTSSRLASSDWKYFHITESSAHLQIMEISVATLHHYTVGFLEKYSSANCYAGMMKEFPFVDYATHFWIDHAYRTDEESREKSLWMIKMRSSDEAHLTNWLHLKERLHRLFRSYHQSMESEICKLLKDAKDNDSLVPFRALLELSNAFDTYLSQTRAADSCGWGDGEWEVIFEDKPFQSPTPRGRSGARR
jgi:hypothetical protein